MRSTNLAARRDETQSYQRATLGKAAPGLSNTAAKTLISSRLMWSLIFPQTKQKRHISSYESKPNIINSNNQFEIPIKIMFVAIICSLLDQQFEIQQKKKYWRGYHYQLELVKLRERERVPGNVGFPREIFFKGFKTRFSVEIWEWDCHCSG